MSVGGSGVSIGGVRILRGYEFWKIHPSANLSIHLSISFPAVHPVPTRLPKNHAIGDVIYQHLVVSKLHVHMYSLKIYTYIQMQTYQLKL